MKKTFLLFTLALATSFSAFALEECPVVDVDENYIDKVTDLIEGAPSCYEASEFASACSLGSSRDAYMVGVTIKKCEKEFPKMSKKETAKYAYLNEKCNKKYSGMQGTMYISMNAFCHLSVTQLFIELLTKPE